MTLTIHDTGEVITHGQVRDSIAIAKSHGEKFFEQIVWQVENETWTVLGYRNWDEMRESEYADLGVVAPRADRPELVSRLRARGLTNQQVADTIGTSEPTVRRLTQSSNDDSLPRTITDSRGQQRPATYQRREPTPPADPGPEVIDAEVIDADDWAARLANTERARRHHADLERGWRDTCARIAECIRSLDGGTAYGEVFLAEFYPHESDFLAPPQRLTRERIGRAIDFLTTIQKGIKP